MTSVRHKPSQRKETFDKRKQHLQAHIYFDPL